MAKTKLWLLSVVALFSRSVERWLGSSFHFLSSFVRLEKCKCNRSFRNAISQQQIEQEIFI
jgi:hypothetical protein